MADKKISELISATGLTGPEVVAVVQSAETRKAQLSDLPVSDAVQTALNEKADLNAPTFTGTVTLQGNLVVNGTSTTINSTTLTVDDKNIVLADGAADSAAADGAGITIDGADASILYSHTNTDFEVSLGLRLDGPVIPQADVTYDLGTASNRWRDLYLSGSTIDLAGTEISTNASGDVLINDSTTDKFLFDISEGDFHADGDVVAFSTSVSDERLKENISTVTDAVLKIKQIDGVTFTRKHNGEKSAGVIAQQLEKILPEAVQEKALPLITGSDQDLYKTVEYDALHAVLIEAVKELAERVERLENS